MEEARKSQKDWQRKDEGARKAKKKTKDLYKALLKDKRDKLFGAAQISLAGEIDEIKTVLTDIMDAPGGHELAKELISTEISNLKARLVAFCDEYCEDFSTRLSFNEDNQDSDLDGAEDSNISRDDNKNSEADDDNADNSEVDNGHDSGHNGGDDSEHEQEVFSRSQVHRASRRRRRSAKYSGGVFTLDLPAPGDESDKNTNYVTEEESEIEEIHDDKNPDSSSDDSIPARLPKSTTKAQVTLLLFVHSNWKHSSSTLTQLQTVPRSSGQKRASHAAASDRKTKRPRTSDGGSKEPIEVGSRTPAHSIPHCQHHSNINAQRPDRQRNNFLERD